jgi:hypothetical protein
VLDTQIRRQGLQFVCRTATGTESPPFPTLSILLENEIADIMRIALPVVA